VKIWTTVKVAGGALVVVVIAFVAGVPDKVTVDGVEMDLAVFTQTMVAGPIPTLHPTPDNLTYGFCYIEDKASGSINRDVIVSMKLASQTNWRPGEMGTPSPNNGVRMLVFTKRVTEAQANSMAARTWRVVRDADGIPIDIEAIP